jgi:DNA polymerase elongation subunit (family B)
MRVLTLDIETSPHLSFHFRRWQENIPAVNTIEESRMICWAAKFNDEKKVRFSAEWLDDDMLGSLWELLDEADVVVGFNSNNFDLKRINAEFIRKGWVPPSPYQKVDLMLQAKKHFKFSSNKLSAILDELGLAPKMTQDVNFKLWMDVSYHKLKKAQNKMRLYNIEDVKVTEQLYDFMLGWIDPHPNWGHFVNDEGTCDKPTCPNCGCTHLQKHKKRYTKTSSYQQYKCLDCGKYSRGRKALVKAKDKEGLLV